MDSFGIVDGFGIGDGFGPMDIVSDWGMVLAKWIVLN